MYKIKLENTLTHQQYQYQCEDMNNGEKLYFKFNIDTLGLDDGEYKLTLLNGRDKIEAEDILKIGDFNPSTLQYKSGGNTYISVVYDAKLGVKNAVIDSVESTVYPDEEYDGMSVVNINAEGVYNSGVETGIQEGYTQGYTQGTADSKEDIINNALILNITQNSRWVYNGEYLFKEVNVNVLPKILMRENSLKFAYSSINKIPEWTDWSGITDMENMFYGCRFLKTIDSIDTSNVTNMDSMFYNCTSLTTIPQLNTSNVTDVSYMFTGCNKLQSLPLLDFGSVTDNWSMFGGNDKRDLTHLGGFQNLKIDWNDSYGLAMCPNLTYESIMNVINNLYDFRANGDTSTTKTVKFNSNSIALLSDADIAIATNKGWVIS